MTFHYLFRDKTFYNSDTFQETWPKKPHKIRDVLNVQQSPETGLLRMSAIQRSRRTVNSRSTLNPAILHSFSFTLYTFKAAGRTPTVWVDSFMVTVRLSLPDQMQL